MAQTPTGFRRGHLVPGYQAMAATHERRLKLQRPKPAEITKAETSTYRAYTTYKYERNTQIKDKKKAPFETWSCRLLE
jgi:hypothetical protein